MEDKNGEGFMEIKKRSKVRKKEYLTITIDKDLKRALAKKVDNVSEYINNIVAQSVSTKCPTCGKAA